MQIVLRDLSAGLLALWGLANLIGLRRVREIPSLRQARGLAGTGGVLFALALALNGSSSVARPHNARQRRRRLSGRMAAPHLRPLSSQHDDVKSRPEIEDPGLLILLTGVSTAFYHRYRWAARRLPGEQGCSGWS